MPEYLKLKEVAAALKTTVTTLYRWERAGKITFTKIGALNRISREELERFLAEGTHSPRQSAEG